MIDRLLGDAELPLISLDWAAVGASVLKSLGSIPYTTRTSNIPFNRGHTAYTSCKEQSAYKLRRMSPRDACLECRMAMRSRRKHGTRHSIHGYRGDSRLLTVFCMVYEQCDSGFRITETCDQPSLPPWNVVPVEWRQLSDWARA